MHSVDTRPSFSPESEALSSSPERKPECEPPTPMPEEQRDASAERVVEIEASWGADRLAVRHVPVERGATAGDVLGHRSEADTPIVRRGTAGPEVVVSAGARAELCRSDGKVETIAAEVEAIAVALYGLQWARVTTGAISFRVRLTVPERRMPRAGVAPDRRVPLFFSASLLVHGALFGAMAWTAPPFGLTGDEARSREQLYVLQQYLSAAAERERQLDPEPGDEEQAAPEEAPSDEGASGEAGTAGKPDARSEAHRLGIVGDIESPHKQMARSEILDAAKNFGMAGLLASLPSGLTSPFGGDFSMGDDPTNAYGNLFGKTIGESWGTGGLSPSGTGLGGGYRGETIGMGGIDTCGANGCGPGSFGGLAKAGGPRHATKAPRVRPAGKTTVEGTLAPAVIQRVVRQNFGRFRFCYESGLARNPNLEGRVTARFVIARDGSVQTVMSGGSDLPDPQVVSCVLSAYRGLSFPAPGNGIVTVTYPIVFSPAA